jgi:hypothetical protein
MHKVVGSLRSAGVLQTGPRRSTVVAAPERITTRAVPRERWGEEPCGPLVWQSVARRIEEDMLCGVFGSESALPSLKEMHGHYGANYRTLRKAVDDLVAQRLLIRHGRALRIARHARRPGGHEVLVVLPGINEDLTLDYLDARHLRVVEESCRAAHVQPLFVRYDERAGSYRYVLHARGTEWGERATDNLLGSVWIVLYESHVNDDCCTRMLAHGRPVAVFDAIGSLNYPPYFLDNRRVKFFCNPDMARPSEVATQHLLHLGHRHIGFFSTMFEQYWCKERLTGIRRALRSAGLGADMAHAFVVDSFGLPAEKLEPLMVDALQDPRVTGWIFGDDNEALVGMRFLRERGIDVPGQISVIGFNNSMEALKHDLTSYYENSEALLRAAVNYVISPAALGRAGRRKVIAFDGYLVERGTTAKPRAGVSLHRAAPSTRAW